MRINQINSYQSNRNTQPAFQAKISARAMQHLRDYYIRDYSQNRIELDALNYYMDRFNNLPKLYKSIGDENTVIDLESPLTKIKGVVDVFYIENPFLRRKSDMIFAHELSTNLLKKDFVTNEVLSAEDSFIRDLISDSSFFKSGTKQVKTEIASGKKNIFGRPRKIYETKLVEEPSSYDKFMKNNYPYLSEQTQRKLDEVFNVLKKAI